MEGVSMSSQILNPYGFHSPEHNCSSATCFISENGFAFHNVLTNGRFRIKDQDYGAPERLDPLTCDLELLPTMNPDFGPNHELEAKWAECPIWSLMKLEYVREKSKEFFIKKVGTIYV